MGWTEWDRRLLLQYLVLSPELIMRQAQIGDVLQKEHLDSSKNAKAMEEKEKKRNCLHLEEIE